MSRNTKLHTSWSNVTVNVRWVTETFLPTGAVVFGLILGGEARIEVYVARCLLDKVEGSLPPARRAVHRCSVPALCITTSRVMYPLYLVS